jgi:hypothetical protein
LSGAQIAYKGVGGRIRASRHALDFLSRFVRRSVADVGVTLVMLVDERAHSPLAIQTTMPPTTKKTLEPTAAARPAAPRRPRKPKPPTDHDIASRAYELFVQRGGEHGRDLDDWLTATRELLGTDR